MPIPPTDGILNVLPPHVGDPRSEGEISPYSCTMAEICARYNTSARRKEILSGLISLRRKLIGVGIRGFQWIDGSFVEDVEAQEKREPGDVDVVTFIATPGRVGEVDVIRRANLSLFDPLTTKKDYLVDHYVVYLCSRGELIVELVNYYCSLFSHRKADGLHKGLLRTELDDPADDDSASLALGGAP
jgi:hypothetical protein